MGFPLLQYLILTSALQAGRELVRQEDSVLQELGREACWRERVEELVVRLGYPHVPLIKEINRMK